jgi:transposase InsO family protein
MVQVLHARAKTTIAIRKEIQNSKKSIRVLAEEHNVNFKTILKWKHREDVLDKPFGSKKLRTVLTKEEELAICVFRKASNLPLDDCFISLKDSIPKLTRSNLHRCLKRNNLSVLPKLEDKVIKKKKFKDYQIGYFHIDITEITLEKNNKFYLFVAIDRVSKLAIVRLYKNQTLENSKLFLETVIDECPYKIHTILTDNGAQFTYRLLLKALRPKKFHDFDLICKSNGIRHRLTKFRHPWTNGQVERFNKTIKDATVKMYHYDSFIQLEKHLQEFIFAYNFVKRLKSLKFKTPFDFLIERYKIIPKVFYKNPLHYSRGLNIYSVSSLYSQFL